MANAEHYQVVVRGEGIPITAGKLAYAIARETADLFCTERRLKAEVIDQDTGEIVYTVEPFADNVIPLRLGITPQGVEHGPKRD